MKPIRFTVAVADRLTAAGVIYPKAVIETAVRNAQQRIQQRKFTVHSSSPPTMDNVVGIVNKLEMQGGEAMAEIELTTPGFQEQGQHGQLGVSIDGVGRVTGKMVEDYELTNLVARPLYPEG